MNIKLAFSFALSLAHSRHAASSASHIDTLPQSHISLIFFSFLFYETFFVKDKMHIKSFGSHIPTYVFKVHQQSQTNANNVIVKQKWEKNPQL